MVDISYTRLTLSLDIIRKIDQGKHAGFHELGIIKHQINLGDTISVSPSLKMKMTCNHPNVPNDHRNICWKAVDLLKSRFNIKENLSIDIDKQIPVQGGLAGGSTNAATVLQIVSKLWELNLSADELAVLGRELGMDVPFYFYGSTAFDSEATGVIEPIICKKKLHFVLVVPPFGVSTADAYRDINYENIGKKLSLTQKVKQGVETGDISLISSGAHNDFELSVFPQHKKLINIQKQLIERGATASILSGSGSTMVGITESQEAAIEISKSFDHTMVVETVL